MISWIGWVFVISFAVAFAILLDKENVEKIWASFIFFLVIALLAGLAVLFR